MLISFDLRISYCCNRISDTHTSWLQNVEQVYLEIMEYDTDHTHIFTHTYYIILYIIFYIYNIYNIYIYILYGVISLAPHLRNQVASPVSFSLPSSFAGAVVPPAIPTAKTTWKTEAICRWPWIPWERWGPWRRAS